MENNQPKFSTDEINARIECLKIASRHVAADESEICLLARNIYYWLTTDGDPGEFYEGVELPDGTVIPPPSFPK